MCSFCAGIRCNPNADGAESLGCARFSTLWCEVAVPAKTSGHNMRAHHVQTQMAFLNGSSLSSLLFTNSKQTKQSTQEGETRHSRHYWHILCLRTQQQCPIGFMLPACQTDCSMHGNSNINRSRRRSLALILHLNSKCLFSQMYMQQEEHEARAKCLVGADCNTNLLPVSLGSSYPSLGDGASKAVASHVLR